VTSIAVHDDDLPVLKAWQKSYGISMPEFIHSWISAVKEHKQREMYSKLPMPSGYKKPLAGVRVDKKSLGDKFAQRFENSRVAKEI
jgi:hypothetical protein